MIYMENTLNFSDFLRKSIYKLDVFAKISSIDVIIGLLIALAIALFIFYVYKSTFRGVVYSSSYNFSLMLMCLLTTLVIMTISSNVVLSLGMVGALSIVRFRTALKDPLDIAYMFWAITAGIASGAGIYPIAIIGSLFIGGTIVLFSKLKLSDSNAYILVIQYNQSCNDTVRQVLGKIRYKIKSKTVVREYIELCVEVKVKNNNTYFVNEIAEIPGVKSAVLMGYNGEYSP